MNDQEAVVDWIIIASVLVAAVLALRTGNIFMICVACIAAFAWLSITIIRVIQLLFNLQEEDEDGDD